MKTQLAGLRADTQTCGGCQGTRGPAVLGRSAQHDRPSPHQVKGTREERAPGWKQPEKKKPARMEAMEKEPGS